MTNNTRTFTYKAKRDIISTIIRTAFSLIGFFVMKMLISLIDHPDTPKMSRFFGWAYLCIAVLIICICFLDIFTNTFNRLSIGVDEIVYRTGWLFKKTKTIPAHKILDYDTHQGPLQSICNTMDIIITTGGDDPEIEFHNINDGETAYQLISEIVRKSRNN